MIRDGPTRTGGCGSEVQGCVTVAQLLPPNPNRKCLRVFCSFNVLVVSGATSITCSLTISKNAVWLSETE